MKRTPFEKALRTGSTHEYDYVAPYVEDLKQVIDMEVIAKEGLRIGADPLGGAAIDFFGPIAERYGLGIDVVNPVIDPDLLLHDALTMTAEFGWTAPRPMPWPG